MLDRDHLGVLDIEVRRNAFGRQLASFEAELDFEGAPLDAVFIRAPWVEEAGDGVEVLAEVDGHPVAVRQGNILAVAFHPELGRRTLALHRWLVDRVHGGMRDHRVDALAQILVRYSTKVKKGDVCSIASTTAAEPLVQAIYEEVLRAGGLPIMQLQTSGAQAAFYELASDEQLDWVPPTTEWTVENADVHISVMASLNTRELSHADPKKQARHQKARKTDHGDLDAARGGGQLPLGAHAVPDARLRERGRHVAPRLRGLLLRGLPRARRRSRSPRGSASRSRSSASPSGSRAGRRSGSRRRARTSRWAWPAAIGSPASASTTCPTASSSPAPVEDSVNGEICFSFPASYGGRTVSGVCLRFEDGKVVDASAEQGEEFLIEMLDTDEGARRLGELGIGTNFGISTGTKEILLDEKIGGTVHMAVGMAYPESGGTNSSAVHWDMVCDLREGGSITVDGEELQRDGRFLV